MTSTAAVFGGAAGTVTLGEAISASDLTFNATGYVINDGGGNTLTLNADTNGFSPVVFITGAATTATINAPLAGTGGLSVKAGGTLLLGGANTVTGGVYGIIPG